MTLYGAMELQKYHSDNKIMERVQVWLDKVRFTREKKQEAGKEFEVECMHLPAEKMFLGECDATPEAVAKLAGVHIYFAAMAMERMGMGCRVFGMKHGSECNEYYLVVLPVGVRRHTLL